MANSNLTTEDAPYDSESDLSEVEIPNVEEPSPSSSANDQSQFGDQDSDASGSDAQEAQEESDDAEFDMEESPAPPATNGRQSERSTSTESRRPTKRKLVVPEDYRANPELYGLRRSVCYHL